MWVGRAPSPPTPASEENRRSHSGFSPLGVQAEIQIRVNPRKSLAKEVHPRRLYNTANSNPAFAGNSSATFRNRSAIAEGASSG